MCPMGRVPPPASCCLTWSEINTLNEKGNILTQLDNLWRNWMRRTFFFRSSAFAYEANGNETRMRRDIITPRQRELSWIENVSTSGPKKLLFSEDFMNLPLLNKHKEMRGEIRMDWMDNDKKNQGSSCVMRSARDWVTAQTHWGHAPTVYSLLAYIIHTVGTFYVWGK